MIYIQTDQNKLYEIINNEWEFIGNSPAGGCKLYNKNKQQLIIKYTNTIKLFKELSCSVINKIPFPCDFLVCLYCKR